MQRLGLSFIHFPDQTCGPWRARYNDTYVGDPSKDVGVEADMVLADIKSTLDQDFFLESTTVIYFRFLMFKEAR